MKTTIILLFVALATFSGKQSTTAQRHRLEISALPADVLKEIVTPFQKRTDSLQKEYIEQTQIANVLTDKLMTKNKNLDAENAALKIRLKQLEKAIACIPIHDTTYFQLKGLFNKRLVLIPKPKN